MTRKVITVVFFDCIDFTTNLFLLLCLRIILIVQNRHKFFASPCVAPRCTRYARFWSLLLLWLRSAACDLTDPANATRITDWWTSLL